MVSIYTLYKYQLQYFLSWGFDIHIFFNSVIELIRSFIGNTALHIAAKRENLEIIEFLVTNSASLDAKNNDGKCNNLIILVWKLLI